MSSGPLGRYLTVEASDGVTAVHFRGPRAAALHEEVSREVAERLLELADALAGCTLVVNFSRVTFLTSTLLGKLMALHKRVRAAGGNLVLCDLRPEVYELFQVTRLHTVLDVRPRQCRGEDDRQGQPACGS